MPFPSGLRALNHADFRRFFLVQLVAAVSGWMLLLVPGAHSHRARGSVLRLLRSLASIRVRAGGALTPTAEGERGTTTMRQERESMDEGDEIRRLLREIRDTQREQLAEYRRVTERSLELQQRAVARQEQFGYLYRRMALVGGALVVPLLLLLVYLLAKWSRSLFGV